MTILEILKKHNIYSKTSKDWYMCHCVSHEDKNPSMAVHSQSGYFKCFSCGVSGNYNKLLVLLNEPITQIVYDNLSETRNKLLNLISSKLASTTNNIPSDATPVNFLYRGLTPEMIKEFNIFLSKEYPNRINIPLSYRGKVYAILSRTLIDESPKYLVTKFSEYLYPFSLDKINTSTVFLVEGIFDYFAMYKANLKNTLCTFGVNNRYIVKKCLLEHKITNVKILFDGDDPGINGAYALKNYLEPHIKAEVYQLPLNLDPDTCDDIYTYINNNILT